tara:strand:+ start:265 stop:396 length:132 start_codon:yes stop_codon:yes gene_type:complete
MMSYRATRAMYADKDGYPGEVDQEKRRQQEQEREDKDERRASQ